MTIRLNALPNRVVVDPQNGTGTQTATTAYDYSTGQVTSATDPNGNVSNVDYTNQLLGSRCLTTTAICCGKHWIQNGSGQVIGIPTQEFDYDSLNRLRWVNEGTSWKQQYSYDRYGNRLVDQGNTFGDGIPKPDFGLDTNTNRLTAPAGYTMTYDVAGNLINDTYTGQGQRTYDAENRMKQAWANNQWQTYSYDGAGRRVKRLVNGAEIWQVYGPGGELLAEYAANTAPTVPQKEWLRRVRQWALAPGFRHSILTT